MSSCTHSPLISVLLPVRNGAATLPLAIRSLLLQSFADFELLILDDGSSDGTVDIVRNIEDPRVLLFQDSVNKGLSARLNQGIDVARGKYIARMDADDISFPRRFQLQLEYLESHPEVDLLGTRAVVFRDDGDIIGLLPFGATHDEICARLWRGVPLPHPTWMGKSTWFRKHRYRKPEVLRAEDQELLLRAAPESCYASLDEVLLGYRQGSFQFTKTLRARWQLLCAQVSLFGRRRQWLNLCLAIAAGVVKIGVDAMAAMPGCKQIFFVRMSSAVPSAVSETLQANLSHTD